jgi:hypothetical protein
MPLPDWTVERLGLPVVALMMWTSIRRSEEHHRKQIRLKSHPGGCHAGSGPE